MACFPLPRFMADLALPLSFFDRIWPPGGKAGGRSFFSLRSPSLLYLWCKGLGSSVT